LPGLKSPAVCPERWVPDYLTPGLPDDFTGVPMPAADDAVLIVFAGVPGSGNSTVCERVGAALDIPVFAIDWLLGALTPFGMRHRPDLMSVGGELLTALAYRELAAGRSAILDSTSEGPNSRARWASLAAAAGAAFIPVVCACTDEALHRERVEWLVRGIPGWADAGDWANASAWLAAFPPWLAGRCAPGHCTTTRRVRHRGARTGRARATGHRRIRNGALSNH